jgi:nucleolar protein 14
MILNFDKSVLFFVYLGRMGTKKSKRSKRLSTRKVSQSTATSINLFEVRVNRKKHDILGQKLKSDRGLPGISRSKAIQKVCHTVLVKH